MMDSTLKQRMESFLAPEKTNVLVELPVNIEIWRSLQQSTKQTDTALQYIHKVQVKRLVPLVYLADKLVNHIDQADNLASDILRDLVQGLGLVCMSNHLLHREQRRLIQPELEECYRELTKKDNPISTQLFEPDLA